MYNFNERFPDYDVLEDGKVYKNGNEVKPFKSNKYLQVLLFDVNHKRKVCGVHTIVAMKYLDYYDGCVVHHKDGNPQNNNLNNLEIHSRSEHSSLHSINNPNLKLYCKGVIPWNKGMKMSKDFCEKCRESAKRRHSIKNQYMKKTS